MSKSIYMIIYYVVIFGGLLSSLLLGNDGFLQYSMSLAWMQSLLIIFSVLFCPQMIDEVLSENEEPSEVGNLIGISFLIVQVLLFLSVGLLFTGLVVILSGALIRKKFSKNLERRDKNKNNP